MVQSITTHHNFGKPGIYNVTLNVWGPDGNDTLIKPEYVTAMATSTNTIYKAKLSGSKAKASLSEHKHKQHFKHHEVEE